MAGAPCSQAASTCKAARTGRTVLPRASRPSTSLRRVSQPQNQQRRQRLSTFTLGASTPLQAG